MNVLFLTLAYHPQALDETAKASKDGLQNQINNYQWAFIHGLHQVMDENESLDILNVLPVGVFPLRYRKPWLKSRRFSEKFEELGSLNLPWFKQKARQRKALRAIKTWAKTHPDNRTILLYSLYLPYMQAVQRAKRAFPDLKATVIVTDLPNELGISSGRRGLLQKIEYAMGDKRVKLCTAFDGFILLTRHMAEALPIQGKAQMVMEGLIPAESAKEKPLAGEDDGKEDRAAPIVLYSGTLNREFGMMELLEAFSQMPEYTLWLCGKGDMEKEIAYAAKEHPNIHYFGFVSQAKALSLQRQADVLINPRSDAGVFTQYSFPSKTLEYMRSGKPVLCYKLEGIPADYDDYLSYIPVEGGIQSAVRGIFSLTPQERQRMGESAQSYVLATKNEKVQCKKVLSFLAEINKRS